MSKKSYKLPIMIVCLSVVFLLYGCGVNKVKATSGTDQYIGKNYIDVKSELENLGFTNVSVVALDNLSSDDASKDKIVNDIVINETDILKKGKKYLNDSNIVITYNSLKRVLRPTTSECVSNNVYDVEKKLIEQGFSNIELNNIEDLTSADSSIDEIVSELYIDENSALIEEDNIPFDSKICLTFHSIKKIQLPFGKNESNNKKASELSEQLISLGFSNVTLTEEFDLDTDNDNEVKNTISINGNLNFNKGENIPFDAVIIIEGHYPKPKFKTGINVLFKSNLLFDKYGVDMTLDGELVKSLEHGEDFNTEVMLREGRHIVEFIPFSRDVDSFTQEIDVPKDIEANITIDCGGSRVYGSSKMVYAVEMPNIVGYVVSDARDILKALGFEDIDSISGLDNKETYSKDGIVTAQNFAPGERVITNETVKLTYEEKNTFVKQYWNLSFDESLYKADELNNTSEKYDYLTNLDISNKLSEMNDEERKLWIVKKADITEENKMQLYYVYSGYIEVPNLNGIRLDIALDRLKEARFSGVDYQSNDGSNVNRNDQWIVCHQSTEAGKKINANGKITLTVEKYVAPSATPTITPYNGETFAERESNNKSGDKGKYAYKVHNRLSDQYWIIDFEEGYIYWFVDGDGYTSCDRYRIDSGTLNDHVLFTMSDGVSKAQWSLHFKYKDHPEKLIVEDDDHFETEYTATDIRNAERLRDKKTIYDY